MSGMVFYSGFSKGMQSSNYNPELASRGVLQPNPVFHVYDFNTAVGGPIVKDKLWYYMSVRWQGQRQNTLNLYHNQNAGNPNAWTWVGDYDTPAFSDRTWENYTPRITWQASQRNRFMFVWDEQPICRKCTGDHLVQWLAVADDLTGGGRPWRLQPAARPAGEVDLADDEQAAPRGGHWHQFLPVGR